MDLNFFVLGGGGGGGGCYGLDHNALRFEVLGLQDHFEQGENGPEVAFTCASVFAL